MTSLLNNNLVALFPGQGSLSGGAGVGWKNSRHWYQIGVISEASGIDVEDLLTSASDEEVVRTDRAQIATFALSTIGYLELLDKGIRPRYLLGHSLGEFSALVASGLLSIEDGAKLIAVRGAAMKRCAENVEGSMVALMGGEEGALENLKSVENVWIANINGTGQIVVSGSRAGLDDLLSRNKELGWKRATPLPVGGAFHSPLMAPAQAELDEALSKVEWKTTESTLIANVDGKVHTTADEWKVLLSRQLTSPVEFLDATLCLPENVQTSIEMPPAGILTGLTKRIRSFETQFAPSTLELLQEIEL
jgi:[acyl-carrier-protein] S-malonyltransferase